MKEIGPAYGAALHSALPDLPDLPDLIVQIEAAYADLLADRGPEPEVETPGITEP